MRESEKAIDMRHGEGWIALFYGLNCELSKFLLKKNAIDFPIDCVSYNAFNIFFPAMIKICREKKE